MRDLERIAYEGDSIGLIMYSENIAARLLEAHPNAGVSLYQIQHELVRLASLPKADLHPLVDPPSIEAPEAEPLRAK